jgi:hypothetical protein
MADGIAGLKFPGGTGASFAVGVTIPHSGVLQPPLLGWNTQGRPFAETMSSGARP